jgi:hypothetical protein
MKACELCNGDGEVVLSCCTGDPVDSDFMICPACHEHLGEETCPDCDGTGEVDDEQDHLGKSI